MMSSNTNNNNSNSNMMTNNPLTPKTKQSLIGKLFKRTSSTTTSPLETLPQEIVQDEEFLRLQEESRQRQKQLIAESLRKSSHNTDAIQREKHIASSLNTMKSLVSHLQEKFPETETESNLPGNEIVGPLISKDVRHQIIRGIPPSLRGPLWKFFIGNKLMLNRNLFQIYSNVAIPDAAKNGMVSHEPKRLNFDIDLERTFPALKFFQKGGPMYQSFVSVLECYVKMRPDVGYVQGMSYLVAMLLLYLDEFDAFMCLGNMIQNGCLYGLYKMDSVDTMVAKFDRVLKDLYPHLSNWTKRIKQEYNMNIIQVVIVDWFFTLFSRSLPLDIAARFWDNYFLWSCCAYCKMGLKENAQKISPTVSLTMLGGEYFLFTAALGTLLYFDRYCELLSMDLDVVLYFLSHVAHFHTLNDVMDDDNGTGTSARTSSDSSSTDTTTTNSQTPLPSPQQPRSNMETKVLRFLMEGRRSSKSGKLSGKDYELFDEAALFESIASVQSKLTRKKFLKYCNVSP